MTSDSAPDSPSSDPPSPLRALLEGGPLAALMFSYFFIVILTFWILKPLRKAFFVGHYAEYGFNLFGYVLDGAETEQLAKITNMIVAAAVASVFSIVACRLKRQQLSYAFCMFFVLAFTAFSFLFRQGTDATEIPASVVWLFYVLGDVWAMLMVAGFFAFLNDSVTRIQAKRLYGPIGLGGVAGGAVGSTLLRTGIDDLSASSWLWICLGMTVVLIGVSWVAGALVRRNPPPPDTSSTAETARNDTDGDRVRHPSIEGARLVLRSSYLRAIVAIVGIYQIVSTIMDFQFTSTVEEFVSAEQLGTHFSTVFMITNLVAFAVQLVLTPLILNTAGVRVALLVLPATAFLGSTGFMIAPILLVGSALNTADNAFHYSINQSAKEALYVPTSRQEKYLAKAFIDVFVERFGKSLGVALNLVFPFIVGGFAGVRWLSVITLLLLVAWVVAANHAGRRFDQTSPSIQDARSRLESEGRERSRTKFLASLRSSRRATSN